jgi:hypothetical protein
MWSIFMSDRDIEQIADAVEWKPGDPLPAELPELPDGFVWGYEITAEAEVVHADGSKE